MIDKDKVHEFLGGYIEIFVKNISNTTSPQEPGG